MRLIVIVLILSLSSFAFADCYKFAGKVVRSEAGLITLQIDNAALLKIQFDEEQYNPHIPKGVRIVGNAIGEKGLWKSNKYSIDIPSRDVATYGLYLEKAKPKDQLECLKNTQK